MSAQSEEEEHAAVQESVSDLVRRSLIQLGDLEGVQERIRSVGERLSKVTPPPVQVDKDAQGRGPIRPSENS